MSESTTSTIELFAAEIARVMSEDTRSEYRSWTARVREEFCATQIAESRHPDDQHDPDALMEALDCAITSASVTLNARDTAIWHEDSEAAACFRNDRRFEAQQRADVSRRHVEMYDCEGITVHACDPNPMHASDSDCDLDDDGSCVTCGVYHGEPCDQCGGRGFHSDGCMAAATRKQSVEFQPIVKRWPKTGGWHHTEPHYPTDEERRTYPVSYPPGEKGPFHRWADCGPNGYPTEAAALAAARGER